MGQKIKKELPRAFFQMLSDVFYFLTFNGWNYV